VATDARGADGDAAATSGMESALEPAGGGTESQAGESGEASGADIHLMQVKMQENTVDCRKMLHPLVRVRVMGSGR
jgi:hypothetical protein